MTEDDVYYFESCFTTGPKVDELLEAKIAEVMKENGGIEALKDPAVMKEFLQNDYRDVVNTFLDDVYRQAGLEIFDKVTPEIREILTSDYGEEAVEHYGVRKLVDMIWYSLLNCDDTEYMLKCMLNL